MSDDRIAALEAEVAGLRRTVEAWSEGLSRIAAAAGVPVLPAARPRPAEGDEVGARRYQRALY